jgi:hypothetical protein
VVKPDFEAARKMLAQLLTEPEPTPYEDLEPDYLRNTRPAVGGGPPPSRDYYHADKGYLVE